MSYDDDRTRPLPRVPHPPAHQGPSGGGHDPGGPPTLGVLEERVQTLRQTVTVLAAIALVALAVGFWALLDGGGGDDGPSGAGDTSGLRSEISALDERLENRATKKSLTEIREKLEALEGRVGSGTATTTTTTTPEPPSANELSDLRDELSDLRDRVASLESAAGGGGSSPGGVDPEIP